MKALLLSGGMDSAALAYWLQPNLCLTVDYGQLPAEGEIRAANAITKELGLRHEVIRAETRSLGLGTMAGVGAVADGVPEAWPFRNQLLLTLAAMRAAREGGAEIIIGTVKTDDVHSDGRAIFLENMNVLIRQQWPHITVVAPARGMSSEELIRYSGVPPEILGWTISCHVSSVGCGECRGCIKHIETIQALARLS